MNSQRTVSVIFQPRVTRRHELAARELRKKLSAEAPTAEKLVEREFSQRMPMDIVHDFMQGNWRRRKDRPCGVEIVVDEPADEATPPMPSEDPRNGKAGRPDPTPPESAASSG